MGKQKQKVILPPELPPEVGEDEIEVSDEDVQFVVENLDYAGFVSRLNTQDITKYVFRCPACPTGLLLLPSCNS